MNSSAIALEGLEVALMALLPSFAWTLLNAVLVLTRIAVAGLQA